MSKCMDNLHRVHGVSSFPFPRHWGAFRPRTHPPRGAPGSLQTDVDTSPAKKVAIVSLGCPKNTVDGTQALLVPYDARVAQSTPAGLAGSGQRICCPCILINLLINGLRGVGQAK